MPYSIFTVLPVYNSKHGKQPLTSYSDIAGPDLKNRVAIATRFFNTIGQYVLGLAEENGVSDGCAGS